MSVPVSGYRGTQVFNGGVMVDIGMPDATYADYLSMMGGDVAATLWFLRETGITPPGMPNSTTVLNQTQSVLQDPILQPSLTNVYQIFTSPMFISISGVLYIRAENEVTTGLQPSFILWMKRDKWVKILTVVGTNGVAFLNGTLPVQANNTYKITATNLIVGRSKINWYQNTPPVLAPPTINASGNVVSINHAITGVNAPKIQWRKKNAGWVWQPYTLYFQKPSGSYTIEARALRSGYNDTNAIAEVIIP